MRRRQPLEGHVGSTRRSTDGHLGGSQEMLLSLFHRFPFPRIWSCFPPTFCCQGRVEVRICGPAPPPHAPARLQQDDRGRAKQVDKQHNSTRLHFTLNSGRLDGFVTVWMVPTGIATSGCKVGTRIRRSTADRQRRCEGKRLRRLGSLVGGRNGLQASSFQMMRATSAMVTQGGLFHSWGPMGSLRQEGPVVDEEGPRRMENSITVCRPIAEFPEGTDDRRESPRAAPASATQYPGLDNQLNRQIEASRRPKTASVVAENGVG